MSFYNADLKKVLKVVKKEINETLKNDVSDVVGDVLSESVNKNVYSNYTPKQYERTYQLLTSIKNYYKFESKNNVKVGAIFDDSFTHESYWGSDSLGISAGEDVEMGYIAQWLNENKNMLRNVDSNFMKDVEKELLSGSDPKFIKLLRAGLLKKGIRLVRK